MNTEKEFKEWFDNSPLKDACKNDESFRMSLQLAWEKGADCVKNNVIELLLMEGK